MQEDEKVLEFRSTVQHVLDHLRDRGVLTDEKLLVLILIDARPQSWRLAGVVFRREAEFRTTVQTTDELFRRMRLVELDYEMRAQARGLDEV